LSNPNLGYTKNEILDLLDFYKNEKDKSLVTDCNALGSRTDTQVYSLMEKTIVFQRECTTPGNTRTCGQTNLGECVLGTQTCTSTYQLGPCVGEIKDSVEVCDNLDNNCNDEIDESLSRSTNEVGACSVNTETCMAGVYTPNNEYTPITEPACDDDLIDNDCVGGDAPTCNSISLSTSLVSIPADGSTTSTITASTSDNTGSIDISFTSDRTTADTILPTTCKTDIDSKICTVTVKSSTVGASTISVSASGYADESTTLTFTVPIPVCSAPTFPACAVTDNSITLSWDSVTGATQYGIDCEGEGQSCVSESIVNAPTTSKQYDGLSSNTQYTLKVKVGSSDATCTSPSAETTTTCTTTTTQVCTPNTEISRVCTGDRTATLTMCNADGTGTYELTGQYASECEIAPPPTQIPPHSTYSLYVQPFLIIPSDVASQYYTQESTLSPKLNGAFNEIREWYLSRLPGKNLDIRSYTSIFSSRSKAWHECLSIINENGLNCNLNDPFANGLKAIQDQEDLNIDVWTNQPCDRKFIILFYKHVPGYAGAFGFQNPRDCVNVNGQTIQSSGGTASSGSAAIYSILNDADSIEECYQEYERFGKDRNQFPANNCPLRNTGVYTIAHELGHTLGVFNYCGNYDLITTDMAIGLMHPFQPDLDQAKLDCKLTDLTYPSYQQSYAENSIMGATHTSYPFTQGTGLNSWDIDALNRDPFFFS